MNRRIAAIVIIAGILGYLLWLLLSLDQVGDSSPGDPSNTSAEPLTPETPAVSEPDAMERASDAEVVGGNDEPLLSGDSTTQSSESPSNPIPIEARCLAISVGTFPGETATWDAPPGVIFGPVYGYYNSMDDDELRNLADRGEDGLAQYIYAYDRLLGLAMTNVTEPTFPRETLLEQVSSPEDELFLTAQGYLVDAVRNHNWIAAQRLASIYYPFDKIEARAWLLIEQQAGGTALESRESGEWPDEIYELSSDETLQSEARAADLIVNLGLEEGLSRPSACE